VFRPVIGGFQGRHGIGTRTKVLAMFALAGACALLAVPSIAATTPSGVTIHHKGHHFLFGYVFSPKPRQCAKDRRVRVFRQTGKTQNRRRDPRVGEEPTKKMNSGKYRWTYRRRGPSLIGHSYYVVITKGHGCEGDASGTIHVKR
jgi:hypothetical protein